MRVAGGLSYAVYDRGVLHMSEQRLSPRREGKTQEQIRPQNVADAKVEYCNNNDFASRS